MGMARTITDEEIALIKAMVARDMKNRDIQFFFNRPGRAVNSGRITDISVGRYSNSADIARASDESLNAFLEAHSPSAEVPLVAAAAKVKTSNPLSGTTLRRMFAKGAGGVWRLARARRTRPSARRASECSIPRRGCARSPR
jgi:hypothetical protein